MARVSYLLGLTLTQRAWLEEDTFVYRGSVVATRANGPRTVPVRSASEERSGLEKSAVCAPDNALRTGTVRGPMQRHVRTGLKRYPASRRTAQAGTCFASGSAAASAASVGTLADRSGWCGPAPGGAS